MGQNPNSEGSGSAGADNKKRLLFSWELLSEVLANSNLMRKRKSPAKTATKSCRLPDLQAK